MLSACMVLFQMVMTVSYHLWWFNPFVLESHLKLRPMLHPLHVMLQCWRDMIRLECANTSDLRSTSSLSKGLSLLSLSIDASGLICSCFWWEQIATALPRCAKASCNRLLNVSLLSQISRLKRLSLLSLSYNQIETLPNALFDLTNLQQLQLSWNAINLLPTAVGQCMVLLAHMNL